MKKKVDEAAEARINEAYAKEMDKAIKNQNGGAKPGTKSGAKKPAAAKKKGCK